MDRRRVVERELSHTGRAERVDDGRNSEFKDKIINTTKRKIAILFVFATVLIDMLGMTLAIPINVGVRVGVVFFILATQSVLL